MADIEQVINNLEPLIRDYGVVAVAVVPGPEPRLAFKGAAVASACYSAIRISVLALLAATLLVACSTADLERFQGRNPGQVKQACVEFARRNFTSGRSQNRA